MFPRVCCGVTLALATAAGCSSGGPSMIGAGLVDGGNETDAAVSETPTSRAGDGGKSTSDAAPSLSEPNLEDEYLELPVNGGASAPVVVSVTVQCVTNQFDTPLASPDEVFPAAFVEVESIADAQGTSDLTNSNQQLVLYGALDGSDPESNFFQVLETGGISFAGWSKRGYFAGPSGNAVRAEWCDKEWWPAKIVVTDNGGRVTSEKIRVKVLK